MVPRRKRENAMDMTVKIGDMQMGAETLPSGRRWSVCIRIDGTLVCAVDTNDSLEFIRKVEAAAALCDGAPNATAADITARRMVDVVTDWDDREGEHVDA
jgi:hypothetical protein